MRNLLVALAVTSLLGVASADTTSGAPSHGAGDKAAHSQKNPMLYEALSKAKKGSWAEYKMSLPGQEKKLTVRYTVTDKSDRELTLENESQTPNGPAHLTMTFAPAPPDTFKLTKARMQMGTGPAQDIPAAQLAEDSIRKGDTPGKLVGTEKITVPAGTFDTKHYTSTMPPEAGGMTFDVWMSDKAIPTGVVKMSIPKGPMEMTLSAMGTGDKATSDTNAAPAASDSESGKPKTTAPAKK